MLRYKLFSVLVLCATAASAQESATYAFTGANVVNTEAAEAFGNRTLAVTDGRIVAIGSTGDVEVPTNTMIANVALSEPSAEELAARRPLGVMVREEWLDRARIDAGLAAIAARHR